MIVITNVCRIFKLLRHDDILKLENIIRYLKLKLNYYCRNYIKLISLVFFDSDPGLYKYKTHKGHPDSTNNLGVIQSFVPCEV